MKIIQIALLAIAMSVVAPQNSAPQTSRPALNQSPPLMIGGQNFRLGMSKQEALMLIAECCQRPQADMDSMLLFQKTGDLLGSIIFKNGRVSHLSLNVKQVQTKDASEFIVSLYRTILDGQTVVDSTAVNLSVFPQEMANATDRHILLSYPNGRKIRVSQFSVDDGTVGVRIEEER